MIVPGWVWLWPLGFFLMIGAGVVLIVWLAANAGRSNRQPPPAWPGPPPSPPRPEPLDILRERFARGEINVEEFETAKRALGYPSGPLAPPGPPAPPGGQPPA